MKQSECRCGCGCRMFDDCPQAPESLTLAVSSEYLAFKICFGTETEITANGCTWRHRGKRDEKGNLIFEFVEEADAPVVVEGPVR